MSAFIPKFETNMNTLPIGILLGKKEVKGDVGIEIEVEGNKFPKHEYEGYEAVDPHFIPKTWDYHRDGSLRGADNAEYVLRKPLKFGEVEKAVKDLWKMFEDYGTVLDDSNRTSVHVHLNVQQWYINRLCSFMCLYFSVEELLTAMCGDHRVGNLFCLRAKDAPGIISEIRKFFVKNGSYKFSNGMHYAGFNSSPLHRFGSVEIRTLQGCKDPAEIIQWVQILQRLYDLSEEYTDPRQVIEGFSGEGPMGYAERVLGPFFGTVISRSGMSYSEINNSLYDGIRLAQDLSYCMDWSKINYEKIVEDPFGRKKPKMKIASSPAFEAFVEQYGIAPAPPLTGTGLMFQASAPMPTFSVSEDEEMEVEPDFWED